MVKRLPKGWPCEVRVPFFCLEFQQKNGTITSHGHPQGSPMDRKIGRIRNRPLEGYSIGKSRMSLEGSFLFCQPFYNQKDHPLHAF